MEENFGIVLMIDALGISNYTKDDCITYLERQAKLLTILTNFHKRGPRSGSYHDKNYQISKFGDTLIICYPLDVKHRTGDGQPTFLWDVTLDAAMIMAWGIANKILFRGCISVGEYVTAENTVLGPAVFDASDWYEAANWFGIIISPKSRLFIDSAIELDTKLPKEILRALDQFLVPYDVPLSNVSIVKTGTKELKTVAWPRIYFDLKFREMFSTILPPRAHLLAQLFAIPESKEGEPKFQNGIDYFDWCCKKFQLKHTPPKKEV